MPTPIDPPVDWRMEPAGQRFDTAVAATLGYTDFVISGLSGMLWGTKDDKEDCLPEYSTDADAAIDLLDKTDCWILKPVPVLHPKHSYICEFYHPLPDGSVRWIARGQADTPALAICKAWLSWKERTDDRGD